MKNLFINGCFNFINNHKELDRYNEIKIKYGLEVMYNVVTKTIVIILLSVLLSVTKYTLYICLFYSLLRTFAHGIHSSNNIICWIVSITIYVVASFLSKYINFPTYILIIYSFIFAGSYLLWAPSDTPKRPLLKKSIRLKLKIKTFMVLITELILAFIFKDLRSPIVISIIIELININPFIYKICGVSYQNYKNYCGK